MATDAKNRRLPPERKSPVLLVGGRAPQPPFRRIPFCGYAPFRRFFLPPPAEIFCNRRGWLTSIIANCPAKGTGIFSKICQARRAAASVKRCSKGLGCYPNKQKLRFPATPGTVVLSVCIYKRPACPVAHCCCFRRLSTKFSPKPLTGTSVCATIMGN